MSGSMAPNEETLRQLRRDGLSQLQIAERYGVTRQTAANWLKSASLPARISRMPSSEPIAHKDILPWTIRGEDHHDQIARALRWYNRQRHGEDLTDMQQAQVDKLLRFLRKRDVVVDYDRDEGFVLRPRSHDLDDDDDIIRRPAGTVGA